MIQQKPSFDVSPPGAPPHETPLMGKEEMAITTVVQQVQTATSTIRDFDSSTLEDGWSLMLGGQILLTHSRHIIYRM